MDQHQHNAYKHFFSYVDTIETKMRLNDDSISRKEFESIVKTIIGECVDPNEIKLYFEILDSDKNDCIEISELPPLTASRYQHQKFKRASIVRKPKVAGLVPPEYQHQQFKRASTVHSLRKPNVAGLVPPERLI